MMLQPEQAVFGPIVQRLSVTIIATAPSKTSVTLGDVLANRTRASPLIHSQVVPRPQYASETVPADIS